MSTKSYIVSTFVKVILLVCLSSGILLLSGCGGKELSAISPRRDQIQESFVEPAKTRLENTYPISMPVNGRIGRVDLQPGDRVKAGRELVQFDRLPLEKAVQEAKASVAALKAEIVVKKYHDLERTAMIEAEAAIKASEEALNASSQQVAAERARMERAQKELRRMKALAKGQAIPQSKLDDTTLLAETSLIELRRQEFYKAALKAIIVAVHLGPKYISRYLDRKELELSVLTHRLEQAKATLARAEHQLKLASIISPIDGVVLERFELGNSTVPAGKPLLVLGNLKEIEAVADVMTQDALRLTPGSKVELESGIGRAPLHGHVKRIEPAGFTKLSSLGVEQQRVRVVVALESKEHGLGVGYRVQARFFTGTKSKALIIPRFSVMQAPDRSYYVYKIVNDRLRKTPVQLGLKNDLELEIVRGLSEKDQIVAQPDADMKEGMKVSAIPVDKS